MDWYRLIGVYILGTIGVPVSVLLGPQQGGFNRVVGFGILVHNLAELFILNHIWYGDTGRNGHNRYSGIYGTLYVWIITAMIAFLPQTPLFLILMLQGSCCDWILVATFTYLGRWMDSPHSGGAQHRKSMGCYGKLGTAAAVTHILSIQPLFFGFATSYLILNGITIIFLMPTFILYIFFSSADKNHAVIIIQPSGEEHKKLTMNVQGAQQKTNVMLAQSVELKQRNTDKNESEAQDDENKTDATKDEVVDALSNLQQNNDEDDDNKKGKGVTYGSIIRRGLTHIDPATKKPLKIVVAFGVLMCVANSLIVFFSPCYIDMKPIICD